MRRYGQNLLCLLPFVAMGVMLRSCTTLICYPKIGSFSDAVLGILTGIVYDISFFSLLFIMLILSGFVLKENVIRRVIYPVIFLWLVLSAVDVFAFNYTGVRASLSSLNLFSFKDLADKVGLSFITIMAGLFFTVFLVMFFRWRHQFSVPYTNEPIARRVIFLLVLALASLIYIPYPLNYYSDQLPISKEGRQLAINPFYSWGTSFFNQADEYPMPVEEAISIYRKENKINPDVKNFIARKVDYSNGPKFDRVLLILMESFGSARIGALNGRKALSPHFDSLCREGMLYEKCFSCGPRTQFAVSSALYGFPHILQYNLFRHNKSKLPFQGLLSLLSRGEFRSHFLHGGDAHYDDMDLLMRANDTLSIRDANDIETFVFRNKWGVDDKSFFDYSTDYIAQQGGKNFFCMLTMTNHGPYQLPDDFVPSAGSEALSDAEKTFLYSDEALDKFIAGLKRKGIYDNSLIIVTGDHGESYSDEDNETKIYNVPLLIIDHHNKGISRHVCSHADIAEYILSKTGYCGTSHLMGQGLVSSNSSRAFYRSYQNELFMATDSCIYRYNLGSGDLARVNCETNLYVKDITPVEQNSPASRLITKTILSYYSVNRYLFETGAYRADE